MSEPLSRRSFLKLAAAASTAAVPGCKPAARSLIPYVVADPNVIPGMPQFYATTCTECAAGCGLVARIFDGRAILLQGNPQDPIGRGAVCARGQAALQGVYNPDRLSRPQLRDANGNLQPTEWNVALGTIADHLTNARNAGRDRVAFFGAPQGPTFEKIVRAWLGAFGSTRAVFYEAFTTEGARSASERLFGTRDLPQYHLDRADVLLSLGADFIETWLSPVQYARQYGEFRAPRQRRGGLDIGRSFYVGPRLNLTASKCDEWVSAAPGTEAQVAWAILRIMVDQRWISQNSNLKPGDLQSLLANSDPQAVAQSSGVPVETMQRIAEQLGKAEAPLVIASTEDAGLCSAAYVLNAATGALGNTMTFLAGSPAEAVATPKDLIATVNAMLSGGVDVAVVTDGNPLFSLPPQFRMAAALQRVPFVVWLGTVPDETSRMASLLLPAKHPLETWRDTAPRAGVHGLGQPIMQPAVPSRAVADVLLATVPESVNLPWRTAEEAIKAGWRDLGTASGNEDADSFWTKVRQEGGYFTEPKPSAPKPIELKALNGTIKAPQPSSNNQPTLFAYPHIFLYDGSGADKPWLQEIPEPITQLVWDSWAEIHPETARSIGVEQNQLLHLSTDVAAIEVPAYLSDRVHPGVIAVPLGQGHTSYGRYAGGRGANPFVLLDLYARHTTVKATALAGSRKLVSPQFQDQELAAGRGSMLGREIILAMSLAQLAGGHAPEIEAPPPEPYEMYPPYAYNVHKWGMTIDVNACVGCSACVAACYGENNLPVVGKELVDQGRIMSWIRIERYFPDPSHAADAPLAYLAPMLCQQCNHAPCEPVCPVFASYHTQEGLNGQIYNRCVGTRYCENNCPYKVRRFNWFKPKYDYPLNLQLNPDVSVRGAGVMEKCTFCVQRIQRVEITARIEKRPVRDGEIETACQAACPTRAISFGDMNDPQSEMMKRRADNKVRNYLALEDLNTQPAIAYLRDLYRSQGKA
ncbi:MAG TPA: molybdopterin-dependent oxidoreductase [Candidatus Binataceae bacterium]|nr:molybdopterin-dependent oxidoreductase [Candidatus Binataceae bacterium]